MQRLELDQPREGVERKTLYRFMTPQGWLMYNAKTQLAYSPLLEEGKRSVKLGPIQGALLEVLLQIPDAVHSSEALYQRIWGIKVEKLNHAQISQLRMALKDVRDKLGEEKPGSTLHPHYKLIHTIPEHGLTLVKPEAAFSVDSFVHEAPDGIVVFDHARLVAHSPFVEDGVRPIVLTAAEGEKLQEIISPQDQNADSANRHHLVSSLRRKFDDWFPHRLIVNKNGRYKLAEKRSIQVTAPSSA